MKRKFTILAAAFALLAFLAIPVGMWGQSDHSTDYTGNITLSTVGGANASACEIIISNNTYDGIKAGTSSKTGAVVITVPAGTKYLHMHAAAWNNTTCSLAVTPTSYSEDIALTANSGIANNSPFTFNGDPSTSDYYKVITFSDALNAETALTFTAVGGKRFVIWGVTSEEEGTATTIATPTFTPASGTEFGNEGLQVSISCETEGVDLYYTLDGSEPDDESNPYNGPISLTETTTIKAIAYDGDDNTSYIATATYTYVDPNAPGTENNPYTVAQARAAIDTNVGTQGVYATGIVSDIPTAYSTQYSNITFNMVDEEGDEDFLQAYRCGGDEAADVAVGDIVVVYGNLTQYGSTYEFGQGCQLVSLTHPTGYVEAPTFNPAGGTYDEAQTVTISCTDANAVIYYTLDGTEPTDASTQYTAAINVTTTTTIKAIAYVGTNASAVTTATYNIVSLANISDITEVGAAYEVQGTVVATNSRGFVMGDGTGYVYYYKNEAVSQSIGDMVKVLGTTGTYGQIIQFTNAATITVATSSNYNGTPAATLITEVPDYSEGYHLSTYFEFEGALTQTGNSYFITLGEAQIQISYPTSGQGTTLSALDGKNVHVKGYFAGINSNSFFTVMLESVEEVVSITPVINADNITLAYDATSGEIAYTIDNPVEGTVLSATTTADWISNIAVGESSITFDVTENEGEEDRTATIILSYAGANNKEVTVTQGHFVLDYAVLPFIWEGGSKADFLALNGVSAHGLGTDYAASNAPYLIKFDTDGDYILVKTDSQPGIVTIGVKMLGGSNTSTITVQGSTDGETFDEGEALTISGSQNDTVILVSTRTFDEDVRYVKLLFTKGSNVGVGPITIAKPSTEPIITVSPTIVEATAEGGSGSLIVTYQNITEINASVYFCDANGGEASYDWITASINVENNVEYTISGNDGEARTAYFKVKIGETYSNLVTITQAAYVVPPTPGEWVLTNLADLTENDVFVIVGDNGSTYAMSNDNGTASAPAVVAVTVVDNTLSGEITANLQWNISITDDGYIFYPNGETETWLYCTNTNNGVRVGINENNVFTLSEEGYLVNTGTSRYIGIYNSQDWRCYTSINSNISGQSFAFYKKVTSSQTTTQIVALTSGTNWFSAYVDITLEDLKGAIQEALGTSVNASLKSENANIRYTRGRWGTTPSDFVWDVALMYLIEVGADCEFTLEGMALDPAEHSITIKQGTNWIGYPFSTSKTLTEAYARFAVNGDAIKGMNGNNRYARNKWSNNGLTTLEPGQGYKYTSEGAEDRELVYPVAVKSAKAGEKSSKPEGSVKEKSFKTLDVELSPVAPSKSVKDVFRFGFKR